ncbi:MAG: HU family DNA-binding protein [Muribaculaceae bacterium]|nr:HU family DNA-binding protein [Muribaculaceae bacterium]
MNNKITFPRLATLVANRSGRSKRFSEDFLREFFTLISETLEAHESVKIKGLGTFRLTRVEPRRSVDVTTGEPMEISGHNKVVFIPSKELADAVNAPFEAFTAVEISDDADIDQLFAKEDLDIQDDNEYKSIEKDNEADLTESDIIIATAQEETPEQSDDTESALNEDTLGLAQAADKPSGMPANNEIEPIAESEQSTNEESENSNNIEEDSDSKEDAADETTTETNADREANADVDTNTEVSANSDAEAEAEEEITDDAGEYEEENSRRKGWVKSWMIALGAAAAALFATFIIWYFFTSNDINGIFNKTNKTAEASSATDIDGGKNASAVAPSMYSDSITDSTEYKETEEEVPTAPSDAVVYDTIGATRYLTTMAKAHYGNYNLWPYIYEENKSFLGHPDRIRPGTPVVIPKLSKYGVDPSKAEDIEKAKKLGVEIYARYGKKI